ncbi:hypothetical protein TNCV_2768561 [Trichonephila clavipes]|nr:hypothetical protein TNCV_2768561 [Trichonephila clavipes]
MLWTDSRKERIVGYKSYYLGRSRQIASGIVIFVKNDLTAEPLLKHAMTSSDSLEAIELRALDKIITTILACANVCIPKGHIINGKPFWNDKLQTIKEEKDLARDRADSSGLFEDYISLRKKQAILEKEILNAKRASIKQIFREF